MVNESRRDVYSRHTFTCIKLFILSFVFILLCAGCATKVKVTMLQPARYHEASITKRIAVLPFTGPNGQNLASELEGVLGNIYINDKQYFTLVDRTAVSKTMNELELSLSGAIDEKTAARVGHMVGAEAIYTGNISVSECNDSYYKQKRRSCIKREILYDKSGNAREGKCLRWRTYNVTCNKRTANFICSPKLIDVTTGRILYSRNLRGVAWGAGCEDTNPIPSKAELIERAKHDALSQFRLDVAPSPVTKSIELMSSKKDISSKEAKEKLKRGIAYAGKERMDAACELWEEARKLSPGAPSILYNLGVCAESQGNFARALDFYRRADKALGSPDDNINAALKRATSALKNQKKLEEQLSDQ